MFSVDADDQQALFSGNLDVGAGLDVTGDITIADASPSILFSDVSGSSSKS